MLRQTNGPAGKSAALQYLTGREEENKAFMVFKCSRTCSMFEGNCKFLSIEMMYISTDWEMVIRCGMFYFSFPIVGPRSIKSK